MSSMEINVGNFLEDNRCVVCSGRNELHMSWTPLDPGMRFVVCPNDQCKDFAWLDPPMCDRAMQIMLRLLRMRNNMEKEILTRKKRERMLWTTLGTNWVLFVILLFSQKM
ncbi:hypothetical protein Vadar_011527 [Vaccinium darrowii]|uniref:Uncharacterized protein n=1 Tax=Vaccinium darrowii TaxID=229202 RepID=A0ACB7ZK06_9ERIC|nr:hypothetical protein Vadar_011527 [Vaccinium darrowii]